MSDTPENDVDEEQGEVDPAVPADLLELHEILEYQKATEEGFEK